MDVLGIIMASVAAVIFGATTVMQKYSMGKMDKFSLRRLAHNRVWLVSIVVGLAGMAFYLEAIKLLEASSVQSVVVAAVIIPVISGAVMFKEKLGTRKWLSIAVILVGIAAIVG